ncbi:MAG: hypothetical protein EOO17_04300 [Chloroflexi bacterium]|nr:MAG: hypothetical protein EOO17_04300 [Chloroflexota bacterium]
MIIAEVSLPSTGQGVELGWADMYKIPIICIYKSGSKPSSALRFVSSKSIEYSDEKDMIEKLRSEITPHGSSTERLLKLKTAD